MSDDGLDIAGGNGDEKPDGFDGAGGDADEPADKRLCEGLAKSASIRSKNVAFSLSLVPSQAICGPVDKIHCRIS